MLSMDYPISEVAARTVATTRTALGKILRGQDDRLVVVVGPCSIHDVELAKDYGEHRERGGARANLFPRPVNDLL